ncbi:MAG: molybdopterin molybdotransferase MoeA [Methylococcales symbiont of Iophon sp. n. MRB-2018]|nr:MAG: molybdopterin molybdotransferase MoeA [Methylococcales symbiont of Iophon sp. n. MRB-2018]KAF3979516.1 MAG: molybdopterin molybdotransferase MoeA [Methylococcales symbiont of Iophon sp. n. MRB-2018]
MIDSCGIEPFNQKTSTLITIEQALDNINDAITSINGSERVILKNALGRVLSDSVYSAINIPPDTNSAMDGYAFSSTDILPNKAFSLSLIGTSWAGTPYEKPLKSGQCIRIFTGAVVPIGADSVIMQEHIQSNGSSIIFPESTYANENIRHIGSDIKQQQVLLSADKKLNSSDLGLLASAGIYDVSVTRKLNIAFLSTGDELTAIGETLKPGQIYDSNRYTLNALLNDNCINITDLGVLKDDKKTIKETLLAASKTDDVIISTGGASVGEADYIKELLDEYGQVNFWKIAIKPGKPLAFGKINHCYFFALPGNPVSVITTFNKIVSPALRLLTGEKTIKKNIQLTAICSSTLTKAKGRQEYQRGILTQNASGEFFVESAGKQGSNIMSTMSRANCYIVLAIECESISVGQTVTVEPFELSI